MRTFLSPDRTDRHAEPRQRRNQKYINWPQTIEFSRRNCIPISPRDEGPRPSSSACSNLAMSILRFPWGTSRNARCCQEQRVRWPKEQPVEKRQHTLARFRSTSAMWCRTGFFMGAVFSSFGGPAHPIYQDLSRLTAPIVLLTTTVIGCRGYEDLKIRFPEVVGEEAVYGSRSAAARGAL